MKKRFNRTIKTVLCLLLAAALCLSLSACTSIFDFGNDTVPSRTPVEHIDHITIGTTAVPVPENINDRAGYHGQWSYTGVVQAPLFVRGEFHRIRGYFIQDYAVSEDGREIRVAFPTMFKWHDGEPVTFDDLVFTLEYRRDIAGDETLANLKDVRKTADNQAVLVFSEPDAYKFLRSESALSPLMSKHSWEADHKDENCGPYKVVSSAEGITELELFPGNDLQGEARIDKITIKTYPDKEALINALVAHEIDYIYSYDSPWDYTMADLFMDKEGIDPGRFYGADADIAVFHETLADVSTPEFRKAVLLSIDWNALRELFCGNTGSVASSGLLPPSVMGYDDSYETFKTDREEAARQLEKAGFKDVNEDGVRELPDGRGFTFTIVSENLPERQELYEKAAAIIVAGLKEVGMKAAFAGPIQYAYIPEETETQEPPAETPEEQSDGEPAEPEEFDGYHYELLLTRSTGGKDIFRTAASAILESWGEAIPESAYYTDLAGHIAALGTSLSDEEYIQKARDLQKLISDRLYGFALCWEEYFFPYRTDEFEGQSFLPDTGELNHMLFYRIKKKAL
ncbi:MAG: ABC transporter substrate-binding protein [Firmicutes bacterium]|nr:ABC transporter substrate-binding protein [Bacillota bacterium]